ncbi:MAG: mismatch repair protein MutS [Thermodesulfobacteriota bacterium]|nr:mismatch repair protein MutS [Thermodesulfobacteriota bacterium]
MKNQGAEPDKRTTPTSDLTPAMKQYVELKSRYQDSILFFRMGDFYEMFFEDAVIAAKILEITLTSRNKNKDDSIPLCGFPYHAAPSYIAKLIEKGCKVAICEQTEDPKHATGVVKRDVVRVITPGLMTDPNHLDATENHFIASLAVEKGSFGLAFMDISTGEFRVMEFQDRDLFLAEIMGLRFREIIISDDFPDQGLLKLLSRHEHIAVINSFPRDYFDRDECLRRLRDYFPDDNLAAVAIENRPAIIGSSGAILRYLEETQKEHLAHVNRLEEMAWKQVLLLDDIAKGTLELFHTIQEHKQKGSLFSILDETVTAMGARRLRWWLHYPLTEPVKIKERLVSVGEIKEHHLLREELRKILDKIYDLERLSGRVAMGTAHARDLAALKTSFQVIPQLKALLQPLASPLVHSLLSGMDDLPETTALIGRAIVDDPPLTIREGGIIRDGFDEELDRLLSLSRNGKQNIAALEDRERRKTGIPSLKVGFNHVFGYYIEVTKANAQLVPDDYIRKQTLVNAERYINQELKEFEQTVLHAEENGRQREYELFLRIREEISRHIRQIQETASCLANLDALTSLAEVAEKYGYCCPVIDDGEVIEITDGRHPVVERMALAEGFVPNDTYLDLNQNRLLIITGPNMAGKSTFIRQVALIVIMAQMGGFVPAKKARIGVTDRIFTRIGAADSLARGQSTFMVEMKEIANILNNATRRSLIVLDEVGRGTSTFDGLSIAWAVAEYIQDETHLGARALFATHYHQLTELALTHEGVRNYNIAVREWGDRIIFLRKIMEGGTSRSYGIQVARLAGVPDEVIRRSQEILKNMEKGELDDMGVPRIARGKKTAAKGTMKNQLSLFIDDREIVLNELADLDTTVLTPLEALNRLHDWQNRIGGRR